MDPSNSKAEVSGSSIAGTRRSLCHDQCQKEARWFSEPYPVPDPSLSNDDTEHMEAFKQLIWDHEPGKMLPEYGVTPEDLSRLCGEGGDGQLLLPHVLWILNKLNNDPGRGRRSVMCFAMATEGQQLLSCLHRLKSQGMLTSVRFLLFLMTVKRADDGHVSVVPSIPSETESHWTVAVASLSDGKMVYCDSLGWKLPEDLVARTAALIEVFQGQSMWSIFLAHRPAPFPHHHQCGDKCLNYPVQLCPSMSGVVAVIFTARFVLKDGAFQDLVNRVSQHGTFFDQPNSFSRYLRRKVIAWFVTGVIDVRFLAEPSSVHVVDSRQLRTQCPNTPNPDSVKLSTPDTVKLSTPNTVKPSISLITKPSNSLIAKPSISLIANPSNSLIAMPSNLLIANPSNSLIAKPSNSNIANPKPSNSLIAKPSISLIAKPSISLIANPKPSNSLIAKPSNSNSETNSSPVAPPPPKKTRYFPKLLKSMIEDRTTTTDLKHKRKASDMGKSSSTDDTKEQDCAVTCASNLRIPGTGDRQKMAGMENQRDMSIGSMHNKQGPSSKTNTNTVVQQEGNTGMQHQRIPGSEEATHPGTKDRQKDADSDARAAVPDAGNSLGRNLKAGRQKNRGASHETDAASEGKDSEGTNRNVAENSGGRPSVLVQDSARASSRPSAGQKKRKKKNDRLFSPQTCPYCSAHLCNRSSLLRHVEKQHPAVDKGLVRSSLLRAVHVPCHLCDTKTWCTRDLISHYKEAHGKGIHIQTATFPDKQQFEKWKKELEENTRTKFCQRFGSKRRSSHTVTYYFCHRSGNKYPQVTGKKRQRKSSTYKISGQCTAFLTMACSQEGPVWVEYCVDHVGHDLDLKYLRVTERRVREIKRLSQGPEGEKYKKRLEEMRNSALYDDREIQVTEKDADTASVQCSVSDGETTEPEEASSDLCEDIPSADLGTREDSSKLREDLQHYKENVKTKLSVLRDLVEEVEDLDTLKDLLQHLDSAVTVCRRPEADPVREEMTQQASSSKTSDGQESRISAEGKADPKSSSTVHDSVLQNLRRNEQRLAVESLTEMLTLDWNEPLTSVCVDNSEVEETGTKSDLLWFQCSNCRYVCTGKAKQASAGSEKFVCQSCRRSAAVN